jgi:ABC-2 type transport system ATP-binding protein
MLTIESVTKKYGDFTALCDVTLRFDHGVYGLLAPNGAGKSTLIKMIATLLHPSEGCIYWNGRDIFEMGEEYRELIGYLPQEFGYYPEFTGRDFLLYLAALKGLPRKEAVEKADALMETVGLADVQKKKVRTYSGGMKQRLGIAQALLNDPEVLILDEPTAGLDPMERVRFRELIRDIGANSIVLLSTHIVSDIEHIADDIMMMKAGQLIFQGRWTESDGSLEAFYLKEFGMER